MLQRMVLKFWDFLLFVYRNMCAKEISNIFDTNFSIKQEFSNEKIIMDNTWAFLKSI